MELSISLKFPTETYPFSLNFHPRTMGKFWYFLLCSVESFSKLSDFEYSKLLTSFLKAP